MGDGYGIGGKWGGKKREKRWIQESVRIRSRGEGRRKVKREGREREEGFSARTADVSDGNDKRKKEKEISGHCACL